MRITLLFLLIFIFCLTNVVSANNIDSLKAELTKSDLSDKDKANLLNKLSLEFYKKQDYSNAIVYKKKVLNITRDFESKEFTGKVLEHLGIFYAEVSDFKNSLKCFLEALKIFEDLKDEDAYYSLILNIGTTYIEAGNNDKGLGFLHKARGFYENKKEDKIQYLVATLTNIGAAYNNLNKSDSAMYYCKKALDLIRESDSKNQLGGALINIGEIYLKTGEYNKALEYYNEAIIEFDKKNAEKSKWHAKFGIAIIYRYTKEFDKSIDLFNECIIKFKSYNDLRYLVDSYNQLSHIYRETGSFESSLEYNELYYAMKDSVSSIEVFDKMSDLQTKYEIEKLEQKNDIEIQLIENNKKIALFRWYLISGVLVIFIITILSFYSKIKSRKKFVELKLEKSALEKKQLNNDLENFALHIIQKNEFLGELKKILKEFKKSSDSKTKQKILDLEIKISNSLGLNKELEKIQHQVDKVSNNFFINLTKKFPSLTDNEKRLCALLKLNLSSKEIASLINSSERAVGVARYRLRKKFELKTEDSLTDFLQKFY